MMQAEQPHAQLHTHYIVLLIGNKLVRWDDCGAHALIGAAPALTPVTSNDDDAHARHDSS